MRRRLLTRAGVEGVMRDHGIPAGVNVEQLLGRCDKAEAERDQARFDATRYEKAYLIERDHFKQVRADLVCREQEIAALREGAESVLSLAGELRFEGIAAIIIAFQEACVSLGETVAALDAEGGPDGRG